MRVSPLVLVGSLACFAWLHPSSALTQSESPPAASAESADSGALATEVAAKLPPAADALDTVRLKDGSLYRGTLLEHTPGGRTVLRLHDGSQQTFEAAAIQEVLPAAAAAPALAPAAALAPVASATPPVTALPDGMVRVRVHTTAGLRLFARKGGDSAFSGVCANDCETQLAAGAYDFQLRESTGSIHEGNGMFDLDQNSRVDALLVSRRPARIVGGTILGAGVLTGAILFGRGLAMRGDARDACAAGGEEVEPSCRNAADSVGRGRIIGGVLTALTSAIIGAILVSRRDKLDVSVEPEPVALGSGAQVPFEPVASVAPSLRPVTSGPAFDEAVALLRERESAIRGCIQDTPATAEIQVTAAGAIGALHLYGDLEGAQRDCLWQTLQKLSFPAGAQRAVSIDIQPALH